MPETIFSIIIPTYQRSRQLASFCLPALAGLDYPRENFEVVLVDDGSESPPADLVDSFHSVIDIKLVQQRHRGPAVARNTGASKAKGKILAFTDDDCAPAPDWLQRLEDHFQKAEDAAVGGRTVNLLKHNRYAVASQLLIDYLYDHYNSPDEAQLLTSNNLAMPAGLFRRIGGFDESFQLGGEDREICTRWLNYGYRMIYAAEARVFHAHHLSMRSFLRQHFKYGRGALRYRRTMFKRSKHDIQMELLSFYCRICTYPFRRFKVVEAAFLSVLMVLTQAANTAGFLWEKTHPPVWLEGNS